MEELLCAFFFPVSYCVPVTRNKRNNYDMITVLRELTVLQKETLMGKNKQKKPKKQKIRLNESNCFFHTKDTNEVVFTSKLKIAIDPSPSPFSYPRICTLQIALKLPRDIHSETRHLQV